MSDWPNFFIVGAMRSGTTSLHNYLKIQSDIFLPDEKECVYFSTLPGPMITRQITKQEYFNFFTDRKNEKAVGESSVQYLRDPYSAEKIFKNIPHAKIIIILRNPINRAYSQYLAEIKTIPGASEKSISDDIRNDVKRIDENDLENDNALAYGLYYNQVKRYIDKFGSNQVKIFIYEEFFDDVKKSLKEILDFLEITDEMKPFKPIKHNEYFTPNKLLWKIITNSVVKKLAYVLFSTDRITSMYKQIRKKNKIKPELESEDKKK